MYCGSIKTTTANILFQTLAVVLNGGGDGSRTRVLKAIDDGISMFRRILLLSRLLRYASTRQAR